jgi:23S rRNA pseudouridine1911/1915/1917 synthase
LKNTEIIISGALELDDTDGVVDEGSQVEIRPLVFDVQHHGMRLDRALVELVPEFSRNYIQQLIDMGCVSVNGRVTLKASFKVKALDAGSIELRPTPQSQAFKAEDLSLDMVYVDEHLMVINKPAGLVVHPAPGNWSGTLMNGILGFDSQSFNLPRAGIVHRLDKDTSGLMVVARSRSVMDALVRAIAAREVKRQYLAMAHFPWIGAPNVDVNAPIGRDPSNRLRMAVVDLATHSGKLARTSITKLESCDQGCLVECTLQTGRTHQIRVHMASISHPLVGDGVYGGVPAAGMFRQALHAYRLSFVHPVTFQTLVFGSDLPSDFSQALEIWGLTYNHTSCGSTS